MFVYLILFSTACHRGRVAKSKDPSVIVDKPAGSARSLWDSGAGLAKINVPVVLQLNLQDDARCGTVHKHLPRDKTH